jgi:hypothetical protein
MKFSSLFRELEKLCALVESVENLAKLHGASEHVAGANAVAFIAKKLSEHEELEETAKELGYKSAKYALYGARKKNRFPNVPEDLQHVPDHWVHGTKIERVYTFKNSKQVEKQFKIPACTALQAKKKLNSLLPYVNQLLQGADGEFVEQVKQFFRDPENDFEDFSGAVLGNLAEQAGVSFLVEEEEILSDAEALPVL